MIMIKKSGADKRKGKLNNAGFSLVEVLVAMAVLAILSIPYTQNTISLWKFKNKYIFNKILS